MGGTTVLISGLDVAREESAGKLAPSMAAEGAEGTELGALLGIELGRVSRDSVVEGTGGRFVGNVDGDKEVAVKLEELILAAGSKGAGTSGKFEAPVGREGLKLGYCSGCCSEEGIDSPGGGRSNDCWCCWCKCGSPFGGP